MLGEIGIKLVAEALTKMDKAVRNSADRKRNWVIKTKLTKESSNYFGEVSYKRTYYQNKKTGEYCYLSDEIVGIKAHDKRYIFKGKIDRRSRQYALPKEWEKQPKQ